jgi:hypothetical protein
MVIALVPVTFSAFAFGLVHNHPSGAPAPSEADLRLYAPFGGSQQDSSDPFARSRHYRLTGFEPGRLFQLQRGRRHFLITG